MQVVFKTGSFRWIWAGAMLAFAVTFAVGAWWIEIPSYEPLLAQRLTPSEMQRMCRGLDAVGADYRVGDERVFVRQDLDAYGLLGVLHERDALPGCMSEGFLTLARDHDPRLERCADRHAWRRALEMELCKVLANFPGVDAARVELRDRSFAESADADTPSGVETAESAATIVLERSDRGPLSAAVAHAAARLVSSAVWGLSLDRVQVIDAARGDVFADWTAVVRLGGERADGRLAVSAAKGR